MGALGPFSEKVEIIRADLAVGHVFPPVPGEEELPVRPAPRHSGPGLNRNIGSESPPNRRPTMEH